MADERNFPDVEFVETDTETILDELVAGYEEEFGRDLYPTDPEYMRLLWVASLLSQERSYINIAAKRNLPRYAEGDYLDSIAELAYGIERQEAVGASAKFIFIISPKTADSVSVEAGAGITNDGTLTFETDEGLVIEVSSDNIVTDDDGNITGYYGYVTATCTTAGSAGNGCKAGTICNLVEQNSWIISAYNVEETSGGADEETDDELYARMRESYEGYTTAGTAGAYKYWAMQYDAAIVDCLVTEGAPGHTEITVLTESGAPDPSELAELQEYLSSEEIRPLTDKVTVYAAEGKNFTIELTYEASTQPAADGTELEDLIADAIIEYIEWQCKTLGRDIDPYKLQALVYQTGAEKVRVTSPEETEIGDAEFA